MDRALEVTNEGGGADEDSYEPKLVYNSAMDLFASLKASLDTCSKCRKLTCDQEQATSAEFRVQRG